MNDRPRQNPAYRLAHYAPRQGGFPRYLPVQFLRGTHRFLDHFELKIII